MSGTSGGGGPARASFGGTVFGDEFVTGEAVPLDLRIAQFPSRALAITVDLAVQILLIIGAIVALNAISGHANTATVSGLGIVLVVLIVVGYPVAFETFTRGRSLGKLAVGLRVVREDGGSERFFHALVRGLFAVPEIWLMVGTPAVLISLLNDRGKRLGDFAAGTVVVRERTPRSKSTLEPRISPALAPWASVADLTRIPDDLALALRQFIVRSSSLRPQARAELGQRLVTDALRYVAPMPPPAYAEEVIATIVAERRRREELRLHTGPSYAAPTPAATSALPAPTMYVPPPVAAPPPPAAPTDGGFHAPR